MTILTVLLAFLSVSTLADTADQVLDRGVEFTAWLESHMKEFGSCEPQKRGSEYLLCDGTRIGQAELGTLFSKTPEQLLSFIHGKGIKTEILCAPAAREPFKAQCSPQVTEEARAGNSALHGKYLPATNTIFIRSYASSGSLIYEYLHSLQYKNLNPVYGRRYKAERERVQQDLLSLMDQKRLEVQALEIKKPQDGAAIQRALKESMIAGQMVHNFGNWQDLIDERGLFLLYLRFGKEFGAQPEDLELARKNMEFICKNPKLKLLLPASECLKA